MCTMLIQLPLIGFFYCATLSLSLSFSFLPYLLFHSCFSFWQTTQIEKKGLSSSRNLDNAICSFVCSFSIASLYANVGRRRRDNIQAPRFDCIVIGNYHSMYILTSPRFLLSLHDTVFFKFLLSSLVRLVVNQFGCSASYILICVLANNSAVQCVVLFVVFYVLLFCSRPHNKVVIKIIVDRIRWLKQALINDKQLTRSRWGKCWARARTRETERKRKNDKIRCKSHLSQKWIIYTLSMDIRHVLSVKGKAICEWCHRVAYETIHLVVSINMLFQS